MKVVWNRLSESLSPLSDSSSLPFLALHVNTLGIRSSATFKTHLEIQTNSTSIPVAINVL